jgi:flagellar biosynthesis protein FlhA
MISQPKVLGIAGGLLLLFGLVPGLPKLPFFLIGAAALGFAYILSQSVKETELREEEEERGRQLSEARSPENISSLLQIDPMELEIGYGLIPIVDPDQGGELLNRVSIIRRQIALELGLIVPPIRIRDNMQLPPNTYSIKIKSVEVAKGDLFLDRLLAMYGGEYEEPIEGIETTEPAFGLPAIWISPSQKEEAELKGCTVVDPSSVVATHLTEILRSHAHELLGRQEVQSLINNVKTTNPVIVEELIPNLATVGEVQKILQNLLRERVSVRDLTTILETIADYSKTTKDVDVLTEYVRQALARNICMSYLTREKKLPVITLDPKIEQVVAQGVQQTEQGSYIAIEPSDVQKIVKSLTEQIDKASSLGYQAVILTSPSVRLYFKRLIERNFPNLTVLSYNEVTPDIQVESFGMVSYE